MFASSSRNINSSNGSKKARVFPDPVCDLKALRNFDLLDNDLKPFYENFVSVFLDIKKIVDSCFSKSFLNLFSEIRHIRFHFSAFKALFCENLNAFVILRIVFRVLIQAKLLSALVLASVI